MNYLNWDTVQNASICSQADIEPFGSFSSSTNSFNAIQPSNSSQSSSQCWSGGMTVGSSSSCPVDHTQDPEIIQAFYKLVKSFTLPKLPNVTLRTVHRWALFINIEKIYKCFMM